MRSLRQWCTIAIFTPLLLTIFSANIATAVVIDVPGDQPTLQAAVAVAAISVDQDNTITISNSPIMTNSTVSIGMEFDASRRLVIRPIDNLDRASIVNENPVVPIIDMDNAGYVTLEDLDILRNITNGDNIVVINESEEILIQRCRIGSNWPATGTAPWSNVLILYPTDVMLRNNVMFANAVGTFDFGINVANMADQDNSIRLYNNDVSDYTTYGINIVAVAGEVVLLRNNVVVNHEDFVTEPIAYRTDVQNNVPVVSSHNVAFASAPNVETGAGESITGSSFLNFAKADAPASFVTVDWNMVFDANPDHYRLLDNGPLHDDPIDYGMTVTSVNFDIEVTDDIEKDVRPGGGQPHTDRGADQLEPGVGGASGGSADIKPEECPNPLNVTMYGAGQNQMPAKGGVLPVAVLGDAEFDVNDIDASSVRLEGVAPLQSKISDVAAPVAAGGDECDCTDNGPDGFADLSLKFRKSEIVTALGGAGSLVDGSELVLTLTAMLNDGTPVAWSDCVNIGMKGNPGGASPLSLPSGALYLPSPNPFNPVTTIRYDVHHDSFVNLVVYDANGRFVERLVSQRQLAGEYNVVWEAGQRPSGVYFCRLEVGSVTEIRKMILLK